MNTWSINLYTGALTDPERTQYQILSNLQQVRNAFSNNRLYPYLTELIQFYGSLITIIQRYTELKDAVPGRLIQIDIDRKELVYDKSGFESDHMQRIEELIVWSLPYIKSTIEEGKTIFEFVDGLLQMEEVGIMPKCLEEGYLLITDHESITLNILQFNLSIISQENDTYRSLKTKQIKRIDRKEVSRSPQQIKLELIQEKRHIPNPATYYFDADLDFPYEATMLPVAKRKLMRHLSGEIGRA